MIKISARHPNRCAHNWLIYDLGDAGLVKHIPLYKGTLYDLGAGESPYKDFFLQYADQYVAVDWAGTYHDSRPDVVADLNEPLPVASGIADTVVAISVLEHLREPRAMLNEAFRILKPGGALILQVPWQWWIHEAPYDYYRYTPYGLEYLLGKAGFADIVVEPQGGFFSMVTLKLNYFSARFVRGPLVVRYPIKGLLSVFWYIGQKLAPILDKLDNNWVLEASGYYVTARKT